MSKTTTNLVGRQVRIDFHIYVPHSKQTREEMLKDMASGSNWAARGLLSYDGQIASIVNITNDSDKGLQYHLEMPDGIIVPTYDHFFSLVPAAPEKDAWEYHTVRITAGTPGTLAQLNELGQEGWECFSADDINATFFFKRRVVAQKTRKPSKAKTS